MDEKRRIKSIYFSLIAFQNPFESVEIICNNDFARKNKQHADICSSHQEHKW